MRVGLSHKHAAEALRDLLGRTILTVVAPVVAEGDWPLRAAQVPPQVGGLLLGRYLLGIPRCEMPPLSSSLSRSDPWSSAK